MLFADKKFLAEQFQLELNSLKVHFTTTEIFYFIQVFYPLITKIFMTTGFSQVRCHAGSYNARICQNIFFL